MIEFFDRFDVYLEKDWLFFGIFIIPLLIFKVMETRKYSKKIPVAISIQIIVLCYILILIFIFEMSMVIAGIILFLLLIFIALGRMRASAMAEKKYEFKKTLNRRRPPY